MHVRALHTTMGKPHQITNAALALTLIFNCSSKPNLLPSRLHHFISSTTMPLTRRQKAAAEAADAAAAKAVEPPTPATALAAHFSGLSINSPKPVHRNNTKGNGNKGKGAMKDVLASTSAAKQSSKDNKKKQGRNNKEKAVPKTDAKPAPAPKKTAPAAKKTAPAAAPVKLVVAKPLSVSPLERPKRIPTRIPKPSQANKIVVPTKKPAAAPKKIATAAPPRRSTRIPKATTPPKAAPKVASPPAKENTKPSTKKAVTIHEVSDDDSSASSLSTTDKMVNRYAAARLASAEKAAASARKRREEGLGDYLDEDSDTSVESKAKDTKAVEAASKSETMTKGKNKAKKLFVATLFQEDCEPTPKNDSPPPAQANDTNGTPMSIEAESSGASTLSLLIDNIAYDVEEANISMGLDASRIEAHEGLKELFTDTQNF